MVDLPEPLFLDPVRTALQTSHRHLAIQAGAALRYPGDVTPFGAILTRTTGALCDLHSLLTPEESIWVVGLEGLDLDAAQLRLMCTLDCPQMVLSTAVALPERGPEVVSLSITDALEMVALTDVAFPGFFRPRGPKMGDYFGIRAGGKLIAMGGERFKTASYSEISAVCTHPDYRGKGHAARIVGEIVRQHRRNNIVSLLHVASTNKAALELYLKLGFRTVRTIRLCQVTTEGKAKRRTHTMGCEESCSVSMRNRL